MSNMLAQAETSFAVETRRNGVVSEAEFTRAIEGVAEVEHVGGALPPIELPNAGDSFVGRFVSRQEQVGDDKGNVWHILIFDVLDLGKYLSTGDTKKAKLYQGSYAESAVMRGFFAKAESVGKIVRVRFVGERKAAKNGFSNTRLITIEEIRLKVKK